MNTAVVENAILRRSKLAYETVFNTLSSVEDDTNTDRALAIINLIATYAWHKHPGRFTDLRLEYWAAKIGAKIWADNDKARDSYVDSERVTLRILHVASETYAVGGHTRLLLNLIQGDPDSVHSLVVIRQHTKDVPFWLCNAIEASGGDIVSLALESYKQQVASLQLMMCKEADKVFYHIHPNDGVAVAALAATPRPQVLIINHADHVFWLGSALSDVVICFREWALRNAMDCRNAQKAMVLPIPLNFAPLGDDFKQRARKELKIDAGKVVILTVASFYKFIPAGKYNYFSTIRKIIALNPDVIVKIIGVSDKDDLNKINFKKHDRIELLGVINKPQLYYEAADIYIDAMPAGSYTSLLESMYFSCFPVLQFAPTETLNTENEIATKGVITHAQSEDEQISIMRAAIENREFREETAVFLSKRIKDNYTGLGWQLYLKEIYRDTSMAVLKVRSLKSELMKQVLVTQLDNDAALLSHSDKKSSEDILARWINENLQIINLIDILKLFIVYNFRVEKFAYNFSFKSLLWLVRKKILA